MSWALVVTAPEEVAEIVAAELFDLGAAGVETQEHGMMLMPGTPPLRAGAGRCIAHFAEKAEADDAARALREHEMLSGLEVPAPFEVPAQDWSKAWRKHHRPLKVGPRSWIYPPWELPESAPGDALVCIDPGMAFGTGQHPTTALCLERLDELLHRKPGADVLDVGTGSGILALLAARLGAGRIVGTENDPVAIAVATENASANGLAKDRISWQLASPSELVGEDARPFDIVVANILLNTLTELAPQIAEKVAAGGKLVLSGLLSAQAALAEGAYEQVGLRASGRREREGWVRVEMVKP